MADEGTEVFRVCGESGGVVVAPGDVQAFVEAITSLAGNEPERKMRGGKARSWAEAHLSKGAILEEFESELVRVG